VAEFLHVVERRMKRLWEPVLFLFLSICLMGISKNGGIPTVDGTGERTLAWHQLAFVYGIAFLVFAVLSYALGFTNTSLRACLGSSIKSVFRIDEKVAKTSQENVVFARITLVFALCLGIWVRWSLIDQPMRLDESFSFLTFVNSIWSNVFLYPFPNNHVLNSILERLSCSIVGYSPLGIRLPAFIFGVWLIIVVHGLAKKLGNDYSGLFAPVTVAVWPYLVFFSTNGRGYSLVAFLVAAIAYVAINQDGRVLKSRVLGVSILAALGMLAIPSMLIAVCGLLLWMTIVMWLQTRRRRSVCVDLIAPFTALFVAFTLLLYTPVALVSGGLEGVMANKESNPLPLMQFAHQALPHAALTINSLLADIPLVVAALCLALAAYGMYSSWQKRNYAAAMLCPAVIVGGVVFFLIKRSIPFPRTWMFLIPIVLVAADVGFAHLMDWMPTHVRKLVAATGLTVSLLFARSLVARDTITHYPETGIALDAEEMAKAFSRIAHANDRICGSLPENGSIAYELQRLVKDHPAEDDREATRLFWLHKKPTRPTRGLQDGWRTVVETDYMTADMWMLGDAPDVTKDLDCWPLKAVYYNR
jgi:hypothetical protein